MTFRPPPPPPPSWSDWVKAELFEKRTVMLTGVLDDEAVAELSAQLMMLDAEGDEPIQLHIDSAGGTLDAAAALADVIDLLGVPVHALCVGRAEGPALVVLAVADQRVVSPHASLRLHEPPSRFEAHARELEQWAARRRRQLAETCDRLAAVSRTSAETFAEGFERGRYLTPLEALDLGLIDEIANPTAQVHPLRRQVGFRRR